MGDRSALRTALCCVVIAGWLCLSASIGPKSATLPPPPATHPFTQACKAVDERALLSLVRRLPALRELDLQYCPVRINHQNPVCVCLFVVVGTSRLLK